MPRSARLRSTQSRKTQARDARSRNARSLRLALFSASLATAIAAALIVALSQHTPGTPPASPTPGAARTLYVAPQGNDAGRCGSPQAPCASFNAAYRAARPGDVVSVAGGTYPEQSIEGDASKTAAADVVFEPARGAAVSVGGPVYIYASHVTLKRMRVQDMTIGNYDQTPGRPNATDVTLREVTGRDFEIDSATHVTISGGSWGPASACGGPYGGDNNSIRDVTGVVPANILIDHTTIHDVQSYDLVRCHIEGLAIFAGHDVTVADSRFYGNSVYDAFVQANSGPISGVSFRGNWMAMPVGLNGVQNGTVLGFSAITANVRVEYNRFNYIISLDDDGLNPVYSNFRVIGNVGMLPYLGCTLRGITFKRNLWQKGACSATDVNLHGRALPYRDGANDAAMNYTIPRRYARLLARR